MNHFVLKTPLGERYATLGGRTMNHFVLNTPLGERYATLVDLPLTRAGELMLIGALRDGFAVSYEQDPATTPVNRAASPVATKLRRGVKAGKSGRKPKTAVTLRPNNPAGDKYAIGDTVYLAWSEIEPKLQTRLSQYRMAKGVVAEFQSGFRSVGVRFNGDPELIWFKRRELSRSPEVD